MICVVDASVAVKWFVEGDWANREDHLDQAARLLLASRSGAIRFLQPPHFLAEVAAVLARGKPGSAAEDLSDLMNLEIEYIETSTSYFSAIDLAVRLNHHLFDTLYHAIALEHGDAVFVTADYRYYEKARAIGRIAWLPELDIPA